MMTDAVKVCRHETVEEFYNHMVTQMIAPEDIGDIGQVPDWVSQYYSTWRQLIGSGQINQRHAGVCQAVKTLLEAFPCSREFRVVTVRDLKSSTGTCNSAGTIHSDDTVTPNVTDILIGRLTAETPRSSKENPCICLSDSTGKVCVKLCFEHVRESLPMLNGVVCVTGWIVVTGDQTLPRRSDDHQTEGRQTAFWLTVDGPLIPLSRGGPHLRDDGQGPHLRDDGQGPHLRDDDQVKFVSTESAHTLLHLSAFDGATKPLVNACGIVDAVSEIVRIRDKCLFMIMLLPDVNIIITTPAFLYWQLFLQPNKSYVFTHLKAMTFRKGCSYKKHVYTVTEHSELMNDDEISDEVSVEDWLQTSHVGRSVLPRLSSECIPVPPRNSFHLVSFKGEVTAVLDAVLGVYEIDGGKARLFVNQVPAVHRYECLQPGTVVKVHNPHLRYTSDQGCYMMLYCCLRSCIQVVKYNSVIRPNKVSAVDVAPQIRSQTVSLLRYPLGRGHLDWLYKLRKLLTGFCGMLGNRVVENMFDLILSLPALSWQRGVEDKRRNYLDEFLLEPHECGLQRRYTQIFPTYVTLADMLDGVPTCSRCSTENWKHHHSNHGSHVLLGVLGLSTHTGRPVLRDHHTSVDIVCCFHGDGAVDVATDCGCSCDCRHRQHRPGQRLPCHVLHTCCVGKLIAVTEFTVISESTSRGDGQESTSCGDGRESTSCGDGRESTSCGDGRETVTRAKYISIDLRKCFILSNENLEQTTSLYCRNDDCRNSDSSKNVDVARLARSGSSNTVCGTLRTDVNGVTTGKRKREDDEADRGGSRSDGAHVNTCDNGRTMEIDEIPESIGSDKCVGQRHWDSTTAGAVATTDVAAAGVGATAAAVVARQRQCDATAAGATTGVVATTGAAATTGVVATSVGIDVAAAAAVLKPGQSATPQSSRDPAIVRVNKPEPTKRDHHVNKPVPTNRDHHVNKPVPTNRDHPMNKPVATNRDYPMNKPAATKRDYPMNKPVATIRDHSMNKPAATNRDNPMNKPEPAKRDHPMNKPAATNRDNPMNKPEPTKRDYPMNKPVATNRDHSMNKPAATNRDHPMNKPEPAKRDHPMNKPEPANRDYPMLSLCDVFTRVCMGSMHGSQRNSGSSVSGLFQRVCDVTQVIKLSLKCVCDRCGSMIVNARCSCVRCRGNGVSRFVARASVLVEDGTYVAMVMMASDCVQGLLHMSPTEWAGVEEEVRKQGEVFLQKTSCGYTALEKFLSQYLQNSFIKHSWYLLLKLNDPTTKDLNNADMNEFPMKTFKTGTVSVKTHCLPMLQLQCVAMQRVDSMLLTTHTLIQIGTT